MSEDKKIPGAPPPPDDFSKTTPNINIPSDAGGQSDWDKTNYNFPKQPAADDWGKTVMNVRPIDTDPHQEYGKSSRTSPNTDWGVAHASPEVSAADFGSSPDDFGGSGGARVDKTTPYFRLPEAERAKYEKLPPTPTEQAEQEKKEQEEKGGIPGWVWAGAGLFSMFIFAIIVLLVVYFFILGNRGFEATVKGAPPGSDVLVDEVSWGVTSEDGSIKLMGLKAGRRTIKVTHPNFTCEPREITGKDGVTPEPIIARCQAVAVKPGEDCSNIRLGEEDKAERCYNAALDALPKPPEQFTVEDLVRALNILIVNFDSGKFDVPPKRLAALQKGAEFIKRLPPAVVLEIGGHTDNVGNDASNQILSQNRANSVKGILVGYGVRSEVLQTRGYGAGKPKTDNSTELGKFHNRRIEYSIVKK